MRTRYVSLELSKRGPLNRLDLSASICHLSILRMFARKRHLHTLASSEGLTGPSGLMGADCPAAPSQSLGMRRQQAASILDVSVFLVSGSWHVLAVHGLHPRAQMGPYTIPMAVCCCGCVWARLQRVCLGSQSHAVCWTPLREVQSCSIIMLSRSRPAVQAALPHHVPERSVGLAR